MLVCQFLFLIYNCIFISNYLGSVPLRKLIYRVLPLPPSMYQFVYDFGTVSEKTEDDYIRRIVINEVCVYYSFHSPSFVTYLVVKM